MVFAPLSPQKIIVVEWAWIDRRWESLVSLLPPPTLLENYSHYLVIVPSADVELTWVRLVGVHQKLRRLIVSFVFISLRAIFSPPKASNLSVIERLGLGWDTRWHVWSHHSILLVNSFIQADQNPLFSSNLKFSTFKLLKVVLNSMRKCYLEKVT